jgi:hypothetical protein
MRPSPRQCISSAYGLCQTVIPPGHVLPQDAPAAGITIRQCSLPGADLQAMLLSGRMLAIALVDKAKLSQEDPVLHYSAYLYHYATSSTSAAPSADSGAIARSRQRAASGAALFPQLSGSSSTVGYTGHYIVVCGYDAAAEQYHIRDPAAQLEQLCIPAARLEAARRSFGTDEDLLLITVPGG